MSPPDDLLRQLVLADVLALELDFTEEIRAYIAKVGTALPDAPIHHEQELEQMREAATNELRDIEEERRLGHLPAARRFTAELTQANVLKYLAQDVEEARMRRLERDRRQARALEPSPWPRPDPRAAAVPWSTPRPPFRPLPALSRPLVGFKAGT
ncbi:MAG: hypothetical protein U0169_02325 [Polyangiaceae bacterium]